MTEATFTAEKLEDALALVKRALGAEAMILSSRRLDGDEPRFEVRATTSPSIGTSSNAAPRDITTASANSLLERVLLRNEIPAPMARELASKVLAAKAGIQPRSLREVQSDLEATLRSLLAWKGAAHTSRITALVGPTGVGKTTTIAKLAARDALIERQRVVLVSTDDYRLAGADQLERYADLIGIPCEVASDGPSLARVLARHSRADRIYIDTAGRAPRDRSAMNLMAQALKQAGESIEVQLCLTASTRSGELTQAIEQHKVLGPSAMVFTKLDEAAAFGGVVSAALATRLPLSYFATGQRVPEDLEIASAARLAAVLAGDEVSA